MRQFNPDVGSIGETRQALQRAKLWLEDVERRLPRWRLLNPKNYRPTPTLTSQFQANSSDNLSVGTPLKYSVDAGATYLYGIVTAVTDYADYSIINIAGAALSDDIDELYVGRPEMAIQEHFWVPERYGDATASYLLAVDINLYYYWMRGRAYVVTFAARHQLDDSTSQPKINVVTRSGELVSTYNANNGIAVAAASLTENDAVSINTSNYHIDRGNRLDVEVTVADGGGVPNNAKHLTVICTIVLA